MRPYSFLHLRLSLAAALLGLLPCFGLVAFAQDGAALQAKHAALASRLSNNAFQRQLALDSSESSSQLSGDIYAVVDHPFAELAALDKPANWCEVLMLHLNTKHCVVQGSGAGTVVDVAVGRKFDQPLDQAQRVQFNWGGATAGADYMAVRMAAPSGPMSTRDYRIAFEAAPLDAKRSFVHLSYSYGYGTAARLAMQAYLGTLGSDKVGFTVKGRDAKGQPDHIGGVRGVVERNTMRYYLAIDSFLDAPRAEQRDSRLAAWFDATERYARQLHETERADYLAMKQNEYKRLKPGS